MVFHDFATPIRLSSLFSYHSYVLCFHHYCPHNRRHRHISIAPEYIAYCRTEIVLVGRWLALQQVEFSLKPFTINKVGEGEK